MIPHWIIMISVHNPESWYFISVCLPASRMRFRLGYRMCFCVSTYNFHKQSANQLRETCINLNSGFLVINVSSAYLFINLIPSLDSKWRLLIRRTDGYGAPFSDRHKLPHTVSSDYTITEYVLWWWWWGMWVWGVMGYIVSDRLMLILEYTGQTSSTPYYLMQWLLV